MATTSSNQASSSGPVEISRTFNLPIDKVWKAFSDQESMKKWWGPRDFTCPSCTIDFRVGGKMIACMRSKEGKDMWSTGTYKEILHAKKIVVTDSFADKDGNIIPASEAGMSGEWPDVCLVTLEFEEKGSQTLMRLRHEGIPAEMHDDCVQGWNECLDKLEETA